MRLNRSNSGGLMNIERFKYFLDLATTLNFTETAEINFTTQGNISKQIIAFEKDLDTILFNRKHRKISLTAAGNALLPHAEKILLDYSTL
jgi:LysR family transcriptional activator of glutamate synthase operon